MANKDADDLISHLDRKSETRSPRQELVPTYNALSSPWVRWRDEITFSDRMQNIERLREAIMPTQPSLIMAYADAREQESTIFHSALDREEYDSRLAQLEGSFRIPDSTSTMPVSAAPGSGPPTGAPTVSFGSKYPTCAEIGEGISSTVFLALPPKSSAVKRAIKAVHALPPKPHSALREIALLELDHLKQSRSIIDLLDYFQSPQPDFSWCLVLPYYPLTLESLLRESKAPLLKRVARKIFTDLFDALGSLAAANVIHRDIKPGAILLASQEGPAILSDFGISWHPRVWNNDGETETNKILDVGTGPYRAPEALFGLKDYDRAMDVWSLGCVVAEAMSEPPQPLFPCPPAHEDGSQLMLIKSIFTTLGTPTEETWPKAEKAHPKPWDMWASLPAKSWREIFPGMDEDFKDLLANMLVYDEEARITYVGALVHPAISPSA